jgi:hypothetical protein
MERFSSALEALFCKMSELVTLRIQIGIHKPTRFSLTVPWGTTVEDFRTCVRQEENIDPAFWLILIYNGRILKKPDFTLYELGICDDSFLTCIISKNTGIEIEGLFSDEEDENEQDYETACEANFYTRPFGFAVLPNEDGENAIVTEVTRNLTIQRGVKIGYCVYKVNDNIVFGKEHKEVLNCLKKAACPVNVQFIDKGSEETITFESKPLGFTVIEDKERTNAKVSKTEKSAASKGVKVGSYIVLVNGETVFGRLYKDICAVINSSNFPITLTFRRPPKVQVLSIKARLTGKSKGKSSKTMEKKKKKKFARANR